MFKSSFFDSLSVNFYHISSAIRWIFFLPNTPKNLDPSYKVDLWECLERVKLVSGFSLTPYLESFTPIFGLGTPVFQRISSKLPVHSETPTFSQKCLWNPSFQNPSENPVVL